MKNEKSLTILGIFLIIVSNSLTFFLTNITASANTEYEFHRAAIRAGLAEYDEFLDWRFKSVEKVTYEFLLKHSKQPEIEVKPSKTVEKFYADN